MKEAVRCCGRKCHTICQPEQVVLVGKSWDVVCHNIGELLVRDDGLRQSSLTCFEDSGKTILPTFTRPVQARTLVMNVLPFAAQ